MGRLTFLFWNTHREDRLSLVCELAREQEVDVLVLAESVCDTTELLATLRQVDASFHEPLPAPNQRLVFFARGSELEWNAIYDEVSGRMMISAFRWNGLEFLLAMIHFISKDRYDEADQDSQVQVVAGTLRMYEVEIITSIGETELRDVDGRPNVKVASDHFPLLFRLHSQN